MDTVIDEYRETVESCVMFPIEEMKVGEAQGSRTQLSQVGSFLHSSPISSKKEGGKDSSKQSVL